MNFEISAGVNASKNDAKQVNVVTYSTQNIGVKFAACRDLAFAVVASIGEALVSFVVYDGVVEDDDLGVDSIEDLSLLMNGNVKWDGCSNWMLQGGGYFHGCSRAELKRVSAIMAFCFDWAFALCPEWSKDEDDDTPDSFVFNIEDKWVAKMCGRL